MSEKKLGKLFEMLTGQIMEDLYGEVRQLREENVTLRKERDDLWHACKDLLLELQKVSPR